MRATVLDEVVDGWWEYQSSFSGSRSERKALDSGEHPSAQRAHDAACTAVERGGSAAVELMAALADAAPAGIGALAVGVGPLEDLICL